MTPWSDVSLVGFEQVNADREKAMYHVHEQQVKVIPEKQLYENFGKLPGDYYLWIGMQNILTLS